MDHYIQRTQEYADIIVPGDETSSIKLIATGIYDRVQADFVDQIKAEYPGHEMMSSPVLRCLGPNSNQMSPAILNLNEDYRSQQYYDLN